MVEQYHHTLSNDDPDDGPLDWRCTTCGRTWADAGAFLADEDDCLPNWANVTRFDLAPIVWTGVAA